METATEIIKKDFIYEVNCLIKEMDQEYEYAISKTDELSMSGVDRSGYIDKAANLSFQKGYLMGMVEDLKKRDMAEILERLRFYAKERESDRDSMFREGLRELRELLGGLADEFESLPAGDYGVYFLNEPRVGAMIGAYDTLDDAMELARNESASSRCEIYIHRRSTREYISNTTASQTETNE